jgi:hypothetical protein
MKILDYPIMLIARTLLLAIYLSVLISLGTWVCLRGCKKGEFRYLAYLLINFSFDVFATLIAPILPLFARMELGNSDNNNARLYEPRLPRWLNWFQTQDNSLWGDKGWQTIHCPYYKSHWGQVLWLIRNSAHGLVNGPLAVEVDYKKLKHTGDPTLSAKNAKYEGQKFYASQEDYFQFMTVQKISLLNRLIYINIGWLFDPFIETVSNGKAALKFSIKPGIKV